MPGGLAARVMAWQRRMGAVAGPLSASGEASTGEPVTVELWVAGAWVDITSYTMVRDDSGSIRITRGIRDEGSQTDHATAALQLRNTDGRFSPRNPTGPYFGLIGRNQPLRISVPDGMGGKAYRLWGEVSDWSQGWESSGTDVWTDVEVSGIIRRLAQGPAPERSVLYSAITVPGLTSLRAYWPCEDPEGATVIASAVSNGSAATISGTPTLAADDGFGASDPLPNVNDASITGGVNRYPDPAANQVRFLLYVPPDGLSNGKVICTVTQNQNDKRHFELFYTAATGYLSMRIFDIDGATIAFQGLNFSFGPSYDVRGRRLRVSIELVADGTTIDVTLRLTEVSTGITISATDTVIDAFLNRVVSIAVGRAAADGSSSKGLPNTIVGHLTLQDTITAVDDLGQALDPSGEKAGRRIQRLCGEQGIPVNWVGDLDDTVAVGDQGKANPLSLMQECVLADGGMLYENLAVLGLGYRTRASLYNQDAALVLDYAGYQLAQVPVPVEDDQRLQNKVTVTVNGVSQTYEETSGALSTALPPAGVGAYGTDVTLNLSSTDTTTLRDQAAWRVHLGTVDEARHPQISVNLAHASFVANPALKRAVLALRQGDRVQIQNPPSWLPPDTIDQLILGVEETISHFEHKLTFTCAPASPYTVGYLDDADTRLDTDGSTLAAAATAGATSLSVATQAGHRVWADSAALPAEFPFDIRVGGEVMTVTAIAGTTSPQTFTVTRSVNGVSKAHSAGADVRLATPTILAL